MKLFLKILFFIFTMIITVEEAQSSPVINVVQKEIQANILKHSGSMMMMEAVHRGQSNFINHPTTQLGITLLSAPLAIESLLSLGKMGWSVITNLGAKEAAKGGTQVAAFLPVVLIFIHIFMYQDVTFWDFFRR